LNISIDYWQRALTIINLTLSNSSILINQHDEILNQNRLNELKQKIEFLLNKIDVNSNADELQFILKQEQEQQTQSTLINSSIDKNFLILNRSESNRIQQELQTALSVQTDLNTFNDRRSLRSIRSSDSFQSCPDVKKKRKQYLIFRIKRRIFLLL
jgi:hypothetical protein